MLRCNWYSIMLFLLLELIIKHNLDSKKWIFNNFRYLQARLTCSYTHRFICASPSPTNAPAATRPSPTVPTCLSTPAYILVLNPTGVRSVRESLPSSHIFNNTSEHTRETSLTNAGFQVHIFVCFFRLILTPEKILSNDSHF